MDKKEYYKRIERINNRFKTDRVSADEEYQLVCQRNYLSTKYIEHLEQQCKKQKEVINKITSNIENDIDGFLTINDHGECNDILDLLNIYLDILKEVSE